MVPSLGVGREAGALPTQSTTSWLDLTTEEVPRADRLRTHPQVLVLGPEDVAFLAAECGLNHLAWHGEKLISELSIEVSVLTGRFGDIHTW